MIISFDLKDTEQIWNEIRIKKMPIETQDVGLRKLRMLNNLQDITDLRIPPSNRLEELTGKLFALTNNGGTFIRDKENASKVAIINYH